MKRVYCDKETNMVQQIFDLSAEPELKDELGEGSFYYCYMIDTEEDIDYSYKYNKDVQAFEKDENYVPIETIVMPNESEVIEKRTDNIEAELALTQSAVDFLLMTSVNNTKTLNTKLGGNNIMAGYLAMRIIKGMLSYKEVIIKYPEYKEDIDFILKAEGKGDLIVS